MKTIKKMQYVAPTVEVLEIEMEEGIAGGSGAAAPGTNPSTNGWETGTGGSTNEDAW